MDLKEMMLHSILFLSAIVATVSCFSSTYSTSLWIYLRGVIVGVVITVPDWVFFYRSPLDWLQPLENEAVQCDRAQATSRVKRTHSSKKLTEPAAPPHMSPFGLSSFQCLPTSGMLSTSGVSR